MTTELRHINLETRVQMGKYFTDGLKARKIALIYKTTPTIVNNVIAGLRKNGVIIPYKNKRKIRVVETPVVKTTPELLVFPKEFNLRKEKRLWSNADKRRAYQIYRTGNVKDVATEFEVTLAMAYYLISQGRKVSGIKGKRIVHKLTDGRKRQNITPLSRPYSDYFDFFLLGVVVALFIIQVVRLFQ